MPRIPAFIFLASFLFMGYAVSTSVASSTGAAIQLGSLQKKVEPGLQTECSAKRTYSARSEFGLGFAVPASFSASGEAVITSLKQTQFAAGTSHIKLKIVRDMATVPRTAVVAGESSSFTLQGPPRFVDYYPNNFNDLHIPIKNNDTIALYIADGSVSCFASTPFSLFNSGSILAAGGPADPKEYMVGQPINFGVDFIASVNSKQPNMQITVESDEDKNGWGDLTQDCPGDPSIGDGKGCNADLTFEQPAAAVNAELGSKVTIPITAINKGTSRAEKLFYQSELPVGLNPISVKAPEDNCKIEAQFVNCWATQLESMEKFPVEIVAQAAAEGSYAVQTSVSSAIQDRDQSNNQVSSSVLYKLKSPPVLPPADKTTEDKPLPGQEGSLPGERQPSEPTPESPLKQRITLEKTQLNILRGKALRVNYKTALPDKITFLLTQRSTRCSLQKRKESSCSKPRKILATSSQVRGGSGTTVLPTGKLKPGKYQLELASTKDQSVKVKASIRITKK